VIRWLILLLPVYVGWRLLSALSVGPGGIAAGIALLVICCGVLPLAARSSAGRKSGFADLLAWIGVLSMGVFSSLLILTLLRDVVLFAAQFFLTPLRSASLAVLTAQGTLALTALITLTGLLFAIRKPRVVHVDIPVVDLPKALHGFSIAQISDVHVGSTIKRGFVESIVASSAQSFNKRLLASYARYM
jgi:hypothetical protein